jgi:integrase
LRSASKAIGLKAGQYLTAHRLRGSYATALSRLGVPLSEIKYLLRHQDIKTSDGYIERDQDGTRPRLTRYAERFAKKRDTHENSATP